jgi:hypothetical protein
LEKQKKTEFQGLKAIYSKLFNNIDLSNGELLKLGDSIIALECPRSASLLTYDNIFKVYGPTLGLKYDILKNPPTLKTIIKRRKSVAKLP